MTYDMTQSQQQSISLVIEFMSTDTLGISLYKHWFIPVVMEDLCNLVTTDFVTKGNVFGKVQKIIIF